MTAAGLCAKGLGGEVAQTVPGVLGDHGEVTLGGVLRDGQTCHVGDFLIGGTASAKALWCEWTHPVWESPTISVGSGRSGEGRGQNVVDAEL